MTRFCTLLLAVGCMTALWAAELPITDVVLYSSGVGYFQRTGSVADNATVELSFKTEQINDLLKSLVLLDLDGGQVGVVTYGAQDPVIKTLQAFAVNITDNPTLGQLLNRLRGVQVEVTAANTITGKILGVETKKKVVDEQVLEYEVLNLLTAAGIRSVRLEEISALRILDERLSKELQDALQVVASGLDNRRKPVVVSFNGKGKRRVVVGYLSETPIWKTSYRLVLGDPKEETALLQGWAIVENTSDADWTNVRLSLLSGRPISFIQDLYTPLYIQRPVFQPQLFASLGPVTYAAGLEMEDKGQLATRAEKAAAPGLAAPAPAYAPSLRAFDAAGARDRASSMAASVASAAKATDLGQAFEYRIAEPVTLPRQQSALLPIAAGNVPAWQLSIYNPTVHEKFPLYGLRVKNTTGLHLMGGPVTLYNGEVYAGDATFEDLQSGEMRLLSYAVDLGVAADRKENPTTEEILSIKLVKGMLQVSRKSRRAVEYTFKAKDGKARKLMVEHPFLQGWDLVEPAKAEERTDKLYRFMLAMDGKEDAKLKVVEERTLLQGIRIVDQDTPTLVMYLQTGKMSPQVRDALQQVVEMQTKLQDVRRQRQLAEQEITNISNEQARLRQNMGALDRNTDLYKRYVQKLDEQETRIEELRKQIADLQKQEEAARKALEDYVAGLNLE